MAYNPIHGVRALAVQRQRGVLPADTQIAVEERARELAADQGSEPTAREWSLLRDMALCDLICERTVAELARRGTIFTEQGEYWPVLKQLATFLNTKRLHALALGLRPEPEVERLPNVASLLEDEDAPA